jgi:hypothetical protein
MNMRKGWSQNAEVYYRISEAYSFDLWIGDEPYDIMIAMQKKSSLKKCPFVVIYDFLGLDATTWNPIYHVAAYMTNRLWLKFLRSEPPLADRSIFIGELEDVPDKTFGFMLPNRRRLAEKLIDFVGYVLPEEVFLRLPQELPTRAVQPSKIFLLQDGVPLRLWQFPSLFRHVLNQSTR